MASSGAPGVQIEGPRTPAASWPSCAVPGQQGYVAALGKLARSTARLNEILYRYAV